VIFDVTKLTGIRTDFLETCILQNKMTSLEHVRYSVTSQDAVNLTMQEGMRPKLE